MEKTIYQGNFTWLDVTQPTKEQLLDIAARFNLHPYTVQDCLEPDHLPKFEMDGKARFIIVRSYNPKELETPHSVQDLTSKIALFYTDDCIITIHRLPQPYIEEIVTRYLVKGHHLKPCDMVTRVIWYAVATYAGPAQYLDDEVDKIETAIFARHSRGKFEEKLYHLRRMVSVNKKLLTLTEKVIAEVHHDTHSNPFIQDLKDLTLKLHSNYEQIHEDVSNLLNIYISISAHKTNEVMKVLTIFSVFFMPLTFIAGIYGMNFKYMPELKEVWGYPASLGLMLVIVVVIYVWFKRKKWM